MLTLKEMIDWHCIVSSSISINDTLREKLCFTQFSIRNGWLPASDLFPMFTESIKFYTFHYHVLKVRMFKNVINQMDSKSEWLLLSAKFTAKLGLVFVLTLGNIFS